MLMFSISVFSLAFFSLGSFLAKLDFKDIHSGASFIPKKPSAINVVESLRDSTPSTLLNWMARPEFSTGMQEHARRGSDPF